MSRPELGLSLQFADPRHKALLPRHKVIRWMRAALELPGEMTVRIVDAEEGQSLNREYRSKDYATNVLTFDYTHEPVVAADLVICAEVVEREAKEMGLDVTAHYAHMLVHGTLHAQGYDHEEDDEAEFMEARETEVMVGLGFADPYAAKIEPAKAAKAAKVSKAGKSVKEKAKPKAAAKAKAKR